MLSAPISGLYAFTCSAFLTSGSMVPVEKLRMIGHTLRIASPMAAKRSVAYDGAPSSSRAWMCTTAAPAS
jgi:hypothetical protein